MKGHPNTNEGPQVTAYRKQWHLMDQPGPHPNWDIAIGLLAAVLPGSTGYSPEGIAGHTSEDWQPFDLEGRDLDEVEDDLLDRCAEMTGPLIVVNDTSFASYTFRRGPLFRRGGQAP